MIGVPTTETEREAMIEETERAPSLAPRLLAIECAIQILAMQVERLSNGEPFLAMARERADDLADRVGKRMETELQEPWDPAYVARFVEELRVGLRSLFDEEKSDIGSP